MTPGFRVQVTSLLRVRVIFLSLTVSFKERGKKEKLSIERKKLNLEKEKRNNIFYAAETHIFLS